ncbi:MAG: SGNH/GDSL hydrolase family protein [Chloroflexota bacterium]
MPKTFVRQYYFMLSFVLILLAVGIVVSRRTLHPVAITIPPTVSPGAIKIVTLGDSQTQGYGDERVRVPEAGGYPAMMIVSVIKLRPNSIVKNLGKPGWDSTQLVNGDNTNPSELTLLAQENPPPQIICIWIGLNDLIFHNATEEEQSQQQTFTANIDTILHTLQGRGATLAIALLDDPAKRATIQDGSYMLAAQVAWYKDSSTLEPDLARLSRRAIAYNKVIAEKAAQYGAILVDLSQPGLFDNPGMMSNDGLHPSSVGYAKISEIWLTALLPYLGDMHTLTLTLTPTQ